MSRIPVVLTLTLCATLVAPLPTWAQDAQPSEETAQSSTQETPASEAVAGAATEAASTETVTLDDLQAMLEAQRALIDAQAKQLDRQSDLIAQQTKDIETHRQALSSLQTQVDQIAQLQDAAPKRTQEMIEAREDLATQELQPETPTEILRAGDFPGSIHLPGTNLNAKYGGFVRLGSVTSFDPIGSDDRFIVGSIPPDGTAIGAEDRRSVISAKRSRMNMDVRMDSTVGQFRAFIEGDFAGDGGTENYRLRHAFGQYKGLLMGKTWSTLMDLSAIPEEVDFEGISGQINVRQPQMRIGALKFVGRSWAIGLEDPSPSLTGGEGTGQLLDITGRTTWSTERGHLQLGLILRNLSGRPEMEDGTQGDEDKAFGYGFSLSGSRRLNRHDQDNLKWQINAGEGMGRYINDLASVGGQDGVFDPETGELEPLPVLSGYTAYQRWWSPRSDKLWKSLRSTFVYSYVYVDDFDFQAGDAYKATQRTSFNLMLSPISALDLGFEFIWGERRNKDNSKGDAMQYQFVATFRF